MIQVEVEGHFRSSKQLQNISISLVFYVQFLRNFFRALAFEKQYYMVLNKDAVRVSEMFGSFCWFEGILKAA